jgi:hypothetical protein
MSVFLATSGISKNARRMADEALACAPTADRGAAWQTPQP